MRNAIIRRVGDLMGWDHDKAEVWYFSPNPLLGNLPPHEMVQRGREAKLLQFIEQQANVTGTNPESA
jgi:hypothetical protein